MPRNFKLARSWRFILTGPLLTLIRMRWPGWSRALGNSGAMEPHMYLVNCLLSIPPYSFAPNVPCHGFTSLHPNFPSTCCMHSAASMSICTVSMLLAFDWNWMWGGNTLPAALLPVISVDITKLIDIAIPTTGNQGLYITQSGQPPQLVLLPLRDRHVLSKFPILWSFSLGMWTFPMILLQVPNPNLTMSWSQLSNHIDIFLCEVQQICLSSDSLLSVSLNWWMCCSAGAWTTLANLHFHCLHHRSPCGQVVRLT